MRFTLSVWVCTMLGMIVGWQAYAQEDVADVPSQRIVLSEKQVYLLVGDVAAAKDAKSRGLLLVLPGGDGGEDFNPFVKRIYKNALPAGMVVAELVAVKSEDANQVVWPTAKSPDAKQKFTTEAFMEAVVADVSKRVNVDKDHVMAMGWSSSGPALYASAATAGSSVKQYFIAMSVFKPMELPNIDEMKTKKFYLLHSPEDQVCPIWIAREASKALSDLGAAVKFAEYRGGHGWHGDVFGMIRNGMDWLEQ